MEIALIEKFSPQHYEVWITDTIKIDTGMGDVFESHEDALNYAKTHEVPVVDIAHTVMPMTLLDGNELIAFLSQYLEISSFGEVLSIKPLS